MESGFNLVTCSYVFGASSSAEKVSDTVWALKGWRWRPKRMRIVSLKISIRCHSENVQEVVSVKQGCVWGRWRLKNSLSRKSPCSFVSFVGKIFVTPFCAQPPSSPTPRQTSKPVTMPKNPPAPPSQIKTRSKNKHTHPGVPDRAPPRQTSVEVENVRAVKAQAKAAQKEERK